MDINQNELQTQKEKAVTLATKQLFYSLIYQFNSIIVIVLIVMKFKYESIPVTILCVVFLLTLAYSWYNIIVIALKAQEYISKSGHSLITAAICPVIGNLISSIVVWRLSKADNAESFLYDDCIRHNIRNIEALKFELDDKLRNKTISESEYKLEYKKIDQNILAYHRQKISQNKKPEGKHVQ